MGQTFLNRVVILACALFDDELTGSQIGNITDEIIMEYIKNQDNETSDEGFTVVE